MFKDAYDCVVIGGGPAGATTATLVAREGFRTLLVEREKFPRFHIGESLMPETYWTFKRLGMLPKLRNSDFVKKYSVQFVTASGRESQPFFFDDFNPHECSQTWQVLRSEFDRMMLDNARENGVEVLEQTNVNEVLFEGDGPMLQRRAVGVKMTPRGGGESRSVGASVVVDATGANALLSRRLGIRQPDPKLRKASIFAHYAGARRDSGKNQGATLVLSVKDQEGWFWFIPLPGDVTSIGIVANIDYLISGRGAPEQVLEEEIAKCPGLTDRMASARRISPVHVLSDFSYRASQCAGDGWVLVGDAFGFLDPMYSSGVFLALRSGEMAADAIVAALRAGDTSGARLGAWGDELSGGMQAIRKLVYAFYTKGFSFGGFVRDNPTEKKNLVDLLIGNVFNPHTHDIFESMRDRVDVPESIPLRKPQPALQPTTA